MSEHLKRASELRVLVGYLGEQHAVWWPSQFFSPRAAAFLTPVFSRSTFQAQCQGVAAAAARLHDEVIGLGRTLHLFRLSEVFEQSIASLLGDASFQQDVKTHLASPEAALKRLEELASATTTAIEGAMSLEGNLVEAPDSVLGALAGIYLDAFRRSIKTFPFLREG